MTLKLERKSAGKVTKYYISEWKWIDSSHLRRVWQVYIGTQNTIKERLEEAFRPTNQGLPVGLKDLEFGLPVALYDTAEVLDVMEIINDHAGKKRDQGLTVGEYFVLIGTARSLSAVSKNGTGNLLRGTSLPRIMGFSPSKINGQNFWNHMDYLDEKKIKSISDDICEKLVKDFSVDTSKLLHDTTNFATYIDDHSPDQLAKHGHSKCKRFDLRQVNLSLLVTGTYPTVPLMHSVYEGNINDYTKFKGVLDDLDAKVGLFFQNAKDITLSLDQGHNSIDIMSRLDNSPYNFVGCLTLSYHMDLVQIPLEKYDEKYLNDDGEVTLAYKTKKEVFGKVRTVVPTYQGKLYRKQEHTLVRHLCKIENKLDEIKGKLKDSPKTTKKMLETKVNKILKDMADGDAIGFTVSGRKRNLDLTYHRIDSKINEKKQFFGKRIIFTNRDWPTEQIIDVSRSKWIIEREFRNMNDPNIINFLPIRHWTNNMVRGHLFGCYLGLLLIHILEKRLLEKGIWVSTEETVSELRDIKQIFFKMPSQKCVRAGISDLNPIQKRMFTALNLGKYSN